jgi:hypothetical protein
MRDLRMSYAVFILIVLAASTVRAQDTISTPTGGTVTTIGVTTTGANGRGVSATAKSGFPDVAVTLGDSTTSSFHIFNSASSELLRVQKESSNTWYNGLPGVNAGGPGSYNGVFYSGDPNWGLAVLHPSGDFFDVRLNYWPTGSGTRKAGIYSIGSGYVLYADGASTPNVIVPTGNVSIGGSTPPGQKLVVGGNVQLTTGGYLYGDTTATSLNLLSSLGSTLAYGGTSVQVGGNVIRFFTNPGMPMKIQDSDVQIGPYTNPVQFQNTFLNGVPNGIQLNMAGNGEIDVANIQIGRLAIPAIQTTGGTNISPLYLNKDSDNDVIIGGNPTPHGHGLQVQSTGMSNFAGSVTVTGTLTAGTIYANYQDLAEWVPATGSLPAGTVVVLSDDVANTVKASIRAYDTGVAGVVSPTPGLLLGIAASSKAKIATTGRVRVRVDATKSAIHLGDLLVTSDRPGMAMKSEPLDLAGVKLHRPGTLIGKALEPLASGEGEILVLLSLQ